MSFSVFNVVERAERVKSSNGAQTILSFSCGLLRRHSDGARRFPCIWAPASLAGSISGTGHLSRSQVRSALMWSCYACRLLDWIRMTETSRGLVSVTCQRPSACFPSGDMTASLHINFTRRGTFQEVSRGPSLLPCWPLHSCVSGRPSSIFSYKKKGTFVIDRGYTTRHGISSIHSVVGFDPSSLIMLKLDHGRCYSPRGPREDRSSRRRRGDPRRSFNSRASTEVGSSRSRAWLRRSIRSIGRRPAAPSLTRSVAAVWLLTKAKVAAGRPHSLAHGAAFPDVMERSMYFVCCASSWYVGLRVRASISTSCCLAGSQYFSAYKSTEPLARCCLMVGDL
jgi:hypothetical protein